MDVHSNSVECLFAYEKPKAVHRNRGQQRERRKSPPVRLRRSYLSTTGRSLIVFTVLILCAGFIWRVPVDGADGANRAAPRVEEPFTFGEPVSLWPEDQKPANTEPKPASADQKLTNAEPKPTSAEAVLALCYSPDGQTLATVGETWTVKLWDAATGKLLSALSGHTEAVTSVAFSPDGKLLATAGFDQTVRLWDRAAGKELRVLKGHSNAVNCVAFAPDGATLASGGFDKTVRLWETATGTELAQLKGTRVAVRALAFSPLGKVLASGGGDRSVYLWNLSDKTERARLSGHTGAVQALAFAPDGMSLASASEDRTVRIWDMGPNTPKERVVLDGHDGMEFVPRDAAVLTLAYSPKGTILATGSLDGSLRLWDPAGGVLKAVLPGHPGGTACVAYAPGGRQIATAGRDKTVKLRNVGPPTVPALATVHGDKQPPWFALYSPDGRGLATGGKDQAVRLHATGAGATMGSLSGHLPRIKGMALAPDGTTLALACQDKTVRLWDVATRSVRATLTGHKLPIAQLAFAPDGKTLASVAGLENSRGNTERGGLGELKLWDVATAKEKAALAGHNEGVFGVAFAPDGKLLASASGDGTVKLWDPVAAKERLSLNKHEADVRATAFSPDGKTLASGGEDGAIRLWDPTTGKQLRQIEVGEAKIHLLAFSRDGQLLAASVAPFEGKSGVRVWEVGTGKSRFELDCPKAVSALVFGPDSKTLFLGGESAPGPPGKALPGRMSPGRAPAGEVQIWNVNSNSLVTTLHGHGPISALVMAPDNRTLVSAGSGATGNEGDVCLWQIPAAAGGGVLEGHAGPVGCADYSPDGKTLATGGDDKTIRLWDVGTGQERGCLKGFGAAPARVRFSPDGKIIAVACRSEKVVTLWTLAGKTVLADHALEITDLAFAPEGRRLATAGGADNAGEVKLWDLDTGRPTATLPKQPRPVRSVAFAPNGRTLAVACGTDVALWDPATSTEIKRWPLAGPVCRVAYAPDGATLAVGLETGAVTLHDAATGRALATLAGQTGEVYSLSFSPDSKMLVAAVKEGRPKIWQVPLAQ